MHHFRGLVLATTAALCCSLGCDRSESHELERRCERAIEKVTLQEVYAESSKGKPSDGEQAVIDTVRKASQAKCEAEGLSKEQAACFESIVDVETLFKAADCPAVADNKPSWFVVPPPDLRQQLLEKMKAKKPAR